MCDILSLLLLETRDADELPNEDEATLYRGIHATATTAT
jgi:hypothetical protein